MTSAFDDLKFSNGLKVKNRFMLAPMTNSQSHTDGRLSDDELNWLKKRAEGAFGIIMTCATNVQANGQGFAGQLGIFNDSHNEGHKKLTNAIRAKGSISISQLFHGGMRAKPELIGETPICPSENPSKGARAMTLAEVHELRNNFILAAERAKKCGYDGVEIHGAHGYIIAQFISPTINLRKDEYGGSLENRTRLLFEIIDGIHKQCGKDFLLGVRLSPERFGMKLSEVITTYKKLIEHGKIHFLDISLWDCFKMPEDEEHQDKSLLHCFSKIDRKNITLTVAGNIRSAKDVKQIMKEGVDFVTIGRAAILHHDFPLQVQKDPNFEHISLPVTKEYLKQEGLGDAFVDYMKNWEGFVK